MTKYASIEFAQAVTEPLTEDSLRRQRTVKAGPLVSIERVDDEIHVTNNETGKVRHYPWVSVTEAEPMPEQKKASKS
jgi:hypothetical protein